MYLYAKRAWPSRATAYGLLFAVILFSAHLWPDGFTGKVGYDPVAKVKKEFRSYHNEGPEFPLNTAPAEWTPYLPASFLRIDRKQNLRLWPVVASQLIRSPPATHSL